MTRRSRTLKQVLGADKPAARDERQSAWQVLVASNLRELKANHGDLWDSGKVASDQSIHVRYAGKALSSEQQCYWKVRVWDEQGQPSAWSKPARWTMGLLKPSDWHAKWIGLDEPAAGPSAGQGARRRAVDGSPKASRRRRLRRHPLFPAHSHDSPRPGGEAGHPVLYGGQ